MKKITQLLLSLFCLLTSPLAGAYNMRQMSNIDGLSSSAILSIAHDDDGFLWMGTCDGVYIADGNSLTALSTIYPGISLSGNFIERIINVKDYPSWVLTNHGLDMVDITNGTVTTFPQFSGQEKICVSPDGLVFIAATDNSIHFYAHEKIDSFQVIGRIPSEITGIKCISTDGDRLVIASENGIHSLPFSYDSAANSCTLGSSQTTVRLPLQYAKRQGDGFLVVTQSGTLGTIDSKGSYKPLTDLTAELMRRGQISDMTTDRQGNIFVSFLTDGVIRIKPVAGKKPHIDDLGLKVGVFCLDSSEKQNVVWIGSDCRGLYTFSDHEYSITSVGFSALDKMISHPVRALYLDSDSTLWIGTKGSGILKIFNFNEKSNSLEFPQKSLLTTGNSNLIHNSVFAFAKSRRPILWIATDDGVNYYDYASRTLRKIAPHPLLRFIHDIREENDTLIMATLGLGVVKATVAGSTNNLQLTDIRNYVTDKGTISSNYFFSMYPSTGNGLLLGNRGQGLFRLHGDSLERIPFSNSYKTESVNDVFTLTGDGSSLWLGTGHGLIKKTGSDETLFAGIKNGFSSNIVHDMLADSDGNLWISTNDGIVKFIPSADESQLYNRGYGLTVSEFSDGAAFKSDKSLMFGGVDGFVVINKNNGFTAEEPYTPSITLQRLSILGENVNPGQYIKKKGKSHTLTLAHNQNHFAVKFAAPDFIDASNYSFLYTLDGKEWIDNGHSQMVTFNEMDYGDYKLDVKYINRSTGVESHPYSLDITIKAPWYLSGIAKIVYCLLLAGIAFMAFRAYMRRQKRIHEDKLASMEQQHREELYEEKLRFFTNITHEFCTPLTLIYGPCERILNYDGADDYIKKYVGLVRVNAERLNTLIQELIDFRRIETGNKQLKVSNVNISDVCLATYNAFIDLAERNTIDYKSAIEPEISWNSDFSCLKKILNNLVSNAFKYTPAGGTIEVGMNVVGKRLNIYVYNTGKGLREEDKKRIFNRYSVLDNVEESAIKGSSRNGLGLAICHSMVELLGGKIDIDSEVGKYVRFTVSLPQLAVTEPETCKPQTENEQTEAITFADETSAAPASSDEMAGRHTILIVDDNKEILTLLSDSLTGYNVMIAESAEEGIATITKTAVDLIITDVMMPGTDGFQFTRQIKQNRHTMHIPIIILSAKNSTDEKIEGIESGADIYIGKPFSIGYLKAVVQRLLSKRSELREYYNSSASAYEYNDGKLLQREDKEFLDSINAYIDEHIDDSELSPETLAQHMQMSIRNLYRKFKELEQIPPKDFIKNRRIVYAAKLLLTTSQTVQEIMYSTGFSNRSHFYKEFDKHFGMTPRDYRSANKMKDSSLTD